MCLMFENSFFSFRKLKSSTKEIFDELIENDEAIGNLVFSL
jgi:hypothetical protein